MTICLCILRLFEVDTLSDGELKKIDFDKLYTPYLFFTVQTFKKPPIIYI